MSPQFLAVVLLAFTLLKAVAGEIEPTHSPKICPEIGRALSKSSAVFYPGDLEYTKGIAHWLNSSSEASQCVVEPGSPSDVGEVLQILGRSRTRFAIKGGGHNSNPGFSSTSGVEIYMRRFSTVIYNSTTQTVEIGAGLVWDDVYAVLDPHGVNVVGGRSKGVGVAGLILGGGYSWKSNQYGLTIDTVTCFELVKTNGQVLTVTASSDPDLFFGLKGGMNNFGIVTKFTLRTYPQTQIWGGVITFLPTEISNVNAALAAFYSEVADPKASIIMAYIAVMGSVLPSLQLFYDGPTPPAGIFERFVSIPSLVADVQSRSFLSFFLAGNSTSAVPRGRFDTVSLQAITPQIVGTISNQAQFWGSELTSENGTFIVYIIEPFLPSIYNHSTAAAAFPAIRFPALLPLEVFFGWTAPSADDDFRRAIKQSTANITAAAVQQGQTAIANLPLYPNYAISDTPLERIYGPNLPKLEEIKARVDPFNIMGLAGGFKL